MKPRTRAVQKIESQQRILVAARERFVAVGFASCTIRDVAETAGVSVGLVHAHFNDKRALLLACFHEDLQQAVARIWKTLDDNAPLLEQLTHCGKTLYLAYAQHPELSRVMFKESLFPAPEDRPDELFVPFIARVNGIFEAALARGEITRLPPDALAPRNFFAAYMATLVGGLSGAFGAHADPKRAANAWAASLRELVQLQLEGLGATGLQTRLKQSSKKTL